MTSAYAFHHLDAAAARGPGNLDNGCRNTLYSNCVTDQRTHNTAVSATKRSIGTGGAKVELG